MSVPVRRRTAAVIGGVAAALLLAACGSSSSSTSCRLATNTDPACAEYAAYGSHPGTTVTVFTSILPPEQQLFEECLGAVLEVHRHRRSSTRAATSSRPSSRRASPVATPPTSRSSRSPVCSPSWSPTAAPKPAPAGRVGQRRQVLEPGVEDLRHRRRHVLRRADQLEHEVASCGTRRRSSRTKGYAVPTTWDEMFTLSDKMVADGIKPWCGGIESGGATGWPATDWLEQIVLRQSGGDVYDKWVSHEIKFDSPEITAGDGHPRRLDEEPQVRQRRLRRRQDHRHHRLPGRRQADPDPASAACTSRRRSTRASVGRASRRAPTIAEDGDVVRVLPAADRRRGSPNPGRRWRRVRDRVLGPA